jgi:hypothetical protein
VRAARIVHGFLLRDAHRFPYSGKTGARRTGPVADRAHGPLDRCQTTLDLTTVKHGRAAPDPRMPARSKDSARPHPHRDNLTALTIEGRLWSRSTQPAVPGPAWLGDEPYRDFVYAPARCLDKFFLGDEPVHVLGPFLGACRRTHWIQIVEGRRCRGALSAAGGVKCNRTNDR